MPSISEVTHVYIASKGPPETQRAIAEIWRDQFMFPFEAPRRGHPFGSFKRPSLIVLIITLEGYYHRQDTNLITERWFLLLIYTFTFKVTLSLYSYIVKYL